MKWFFDKIPEWYSALPHKAQLDVMNLMHERAAALRDWKDGDKSLDDAREIVARCNRDIQQIVEGTA